MLRYKELVYKDSNKIKTGVVHHSGQGRKTYLGIYELSPEKAKNEIDTVIYDNNGCKGMSNKQRFELYKKALKAEELRLKNFDEDSI